VTRVAGLKAFLVTAMIAATLSTAGAQLTPASSDDTPFEAYQLLFPVSGEHSYIDTFGAARSEGRTHKGADIFAPKGTPVVAAADGIVMRTTVGETAGRYIVVEHLDGWRSYYLHLDNDTPGTDDGLAGAPALGIEVGTRVAAGDVLDYVGDSGNAEETPSHLHFELHQPDGSAVNPTPHLRAAESAAGSRPQSAGTEWSTAARPPSYHASGTEMVGHFDPGGGFAAGLAVHGDIAYMGTWGRPTVCPASGVRLINVEDPAQPTLVATVADVAEFPGSSTDSIWVGSVETQSFSGDLAVVAVRLCDTSERNRWRDDFRGLAIYDVTNPEEPVLLSTVHSGERTQGANEVTAAVRPDGSLVIAATVMQSLLHTDGLLGDFRLIDATDPRHPLPISDWDVRRDLPLQPDETAEPTDLHVHSVWLATDGMTAWLAAWDAGLVMLDLATAETPVVVAHVPGADGSEGNAHTVTFDPESGLLIRNDEDLSPFAGESVPAGWGGQTLYDATDPDHVTSVATYLSSGANESNEELDYSGYFSAHEVQVVDGVEYVSWYSDGLRMIDLSDPSQPTEVAFFVPPASADPQQHWIAPNRNRSFPLVWGVTVVDGLVFLSDVHTGLWIVRYVPPAPEPQPAAGDAI
jgi:hypothetical protein